MGTFGGHALPGGFFIGFSLWWTVNIFHRFYRARYQLGHKFTATATFPVPCCGRRLGRLPLEPMFMILLTLFGATVEIITGFKDGRFYWFGNAQHATMFFFFGLSGVLNILLHYRCPLPARLEYVGLVLALAVEAVLFNFHLDGRGHLNTLIHKLLIYTILAAAVSCVAEMCYKHEVIPPLARAYSVLLQGTWFWQIGFILYSPMPHASKWEEDNHDHILIATMMFAWHMGVDFLLILLIGLGLGSYHRRYGNHERDADELSMRLIKANGETLHGVGDDQPAGFIALNDSDSDIEEFRRASEPLSQ